MTVIPKPKAALSIAPQTIIEGESATLTWTTQHADTVTIEPGIGAVDKNGSRTVSPTQTTTYTITAAGAGGVATATVIITVLEDNHPPAIISAPIVSAVQDQHYLYEVQADDPDPGDILTYTLERAPSDMTINPLTGSINWLPTSGDAGNKPGANPLCYASGNTDAGNAIAADVMIVVDESGSMSDEHAWIPKFTFGLETHLLANGVGAGDTANLYGLIGYEKAPRPLPVGDGQAGDVYDLMEAADLLRLAGGTEDGWRAIRHVLTDYALRQDSARNIILITDEDRDNADGNITYASLLKELRDAHVILNVVVDARFRCKNADGEWVTALGMDADGVGYLADGEGGYLTGSDAEATKGGGNTISTYVNLALGTGGAAWDLNFLRNGRQDAVSFARALNDIKVREILEHLPPTPQADLSISELRWEDGQISTRVENRGLVDATGPVELHIHAGTDPVGVESIAALSAGASLDFHFPWDPSGTDAAELRAELIQATDECECQTNNHQLIVPLITVRTTDTGGLSDQQTFSISVAQVNAPPVFVSEPYTAASVGSLYRYQAQATDTDSGDSLRYSLLSGPPGMAMDTYSGVVTYTPNIAHVGIHTVELRVEDLDGATDEQTFHLQVNQEYLFPRFISRPSEMRVVILTDYQYQFEALADPSAVPEYDILLGPEGLLIDPRTGLMDWTVADVAGTRVPVSVQIRDQFGNYDVQIFEFLVDLPNAPPTISSSPNLTAVQGTTYPYNPNVQDANFFDKHTWNLVNGPAGMTIDPTTGKTVWPAAAITTTAPEGISVSNPCCLVRENEVASLEARENWKWSSGVTRFTQPLVIPIYSNADQAPPEVEGIHLVVGISWTGGGISNRAVHALNLETGGLFWSYAAHTPHWGVSPAAGDLDGDGISDIVFVNSDLRLVSIDAFGRFKWISSQTIAPPGANLNESSVVIEDIDQNGRPEIVVGSTVFSWEGLPVWTFPDPGSWHTNAFRATPLVADLTGDGRLEVAMYNEVRDAFGSLLWTLPLNTGEALQRAHFGVGDLNGDGRPDLAVSIQSNKGGALVAVSGDGKLMWRHQSALVNYVSPPLVADFTGDNRNDIFLPGGSILFDADGGIVWQRTDVIARRESRNAVAADLNGDGSLEILMHGGNNVVVLSGKHGVLLYSHSWPERSDRVGIVPALVWPDGQSVPRMLVGGNSGLLALQPAWGAWLTRAGLFNQVEIAPNSPRHRNLRILQPPVLEQPTTMFLPDLHIKSPSAKLTANGYSLETGVTNRGTAPSDGLLHVAFYRGDPATGGILLAHQLIGQVLAPGQTVPIQAPGFTREDLAGEIFAKVYSDDENAMECEPANNLASGVTAHIRVQDLDGLYDTQFWGIGIKEKAIAPTFITTPSTNAVENEIYTCQVHAETPNTGDVARYSLLIGPKEARLHPITGELTWRPRWGQTGTFKFQIEARNLSNQTKLQAFDVHVAESSAPNQSPVILSQPIMAAEPAQPYRYQMVAEDPDGQELQFELLENPNGMSIHPRSGLVAWTPASLTTGPVPVKVEVRDERGASVEQSYAITVLPGSNQAPVITGMPTLAINLGETWEYAVDASDPDGDPLEYQLIFAPTGAGVDVDGRIEWTPGANQPGAHSFLMEVQDDRGGWVRQGFTLYVNDPSVNQRPGISSTPLTQAQVGVEYTYQVQAADPDGDALEYMLAGAPQNAWIDSRTGLLRWTPIFSQLGSDNIEVHVIDGKGGMDLQCFEVRVDEVPIGNRQPVILSAPPLTAKSGLLYRYTVAASDPDGDAMAYSLVQGPSGMAIDTVNGQLTWPLPTIGTHPVRIAVSDGEKTVTQAWTLKVMDSAIPLGLILEITPQVVEPGQTVQIRLIPKAAAGEVVATLAVNDVPVGLNPYLSALFVPPATGVYRVTAIVNDGYGQAETTAHFLARDPNAPAGPFVSLTETDCVDVYEPYEVKGSVADPTGGTYRLLYRAQGTAAWTEFATASGAFFSGTLGVFDPTVLKNGVYELKLSARDLNGKTAEVTGCVLVDGQLKVGQVILSGMDVSLPENGFPLTLEREYDSREPDGDFGPGWSLPSSKIKPQTTRDLNAGWAEEVGGNFLTTYYLIEKYRHVVVIRFSDEEMLKFRMDVTPKSSVLIPIANHSNLSARYVPIDGTVGTLEALNVASSHLMLIGNQLMEWGTDPYEPQRFRYTRPDGTQYVLHMENGIESMTDVYGHTIAYSASGITHSSGASISITRGTGNRIETITDPLGQIIEYYYDADGMLEKVVKSGNEPVAMRMMSNYAYAQGIFEQPVLKDIQSPDGTVLGQFEYDGEGRMTGLIDAEGRKIIYGFDIPNHTQEITDRRGNTSVYEYNDKGYVTQKIDPDGHVSTWTYDALGNKLSETDALGNTKTFTYDASGNMLTETDALGNTTAYTYNNRKDVLTQTDPLGRVTTYTYDGLGNKLTETDPLGNVKTFTHDAHGNVLTETNAIGHVTTFAYDANGNKINEIDPSGKTAAWTYDPYGNELTESVTRTTDAGIVTMTTTNTYDIRNRLTRTVDSMGNETRTQYNYLDKESVVIDKTGARTEFEYDGNGNQTAIHYADGTSALTAYDPDGNRTSSTDRDGRITQFEYDANNQLVRVVHPDGADSEMVFDDAGRMTLTVDENGNETEFVYDAAGRRVKVTDAIGNEMSFDYDAAGNQTAMTDPKGAVTRYEYDGANRQVKTIYPDNTFTQTGYDALGRKISETDAAGKTTGFGYDAAGNLTAVTDALGGVTDYSYDEVGNRLTHIDPNGHTETWKYDDLGRVTEHTLPLGMTEAYTYDANGNMLSHTDFNGAATQYEYSPCCGRLTRKVYPDSSSVDFAYSGTGLRQSVTDARGETRYAYDNRGRLEQVTNPDGSTLAYTYDPKGNRTSVTVPSGTTAYAFDQLNRLVSVTDPDGGVTTYAYDANGNRKTVSYPNGTLAEYSYDVQNRLINLENRTSTGDVITSYQYTLDPAGNRTKVTENTGRVVDYTYDAVYRLTAETITDPAAGNTATTYIYDAAGNRLSKTDTAGTTSYTYDANDRLTTESESGASYVYSYDANGNTIGKTGNGETITYEYDFENRLLALATPASQIQYAYDADGIRISQNVDGTATDFIIDKNRDYAQVLEERDGIGSLTTSYVYGDDLISQTRGGTESFYHYDGLGSTRALSDEAGTATDTYTYEAFGDLTTSTGTTQNNYRFTGEQYDPNAGFYYLRARYYNPGVGRFVTVDPIELKKCNSCSCDMLSFLREYYSGGVDKFIKRSPYYKYLFEPMNNNKYIYALSDPINHLDPSGNMALAALMPTFGVNLTARTNATASILRVGLSARNKAVVINLVARAVILTTIVLMNEIEETLEEKCDKIHYDIDIPTCNQISKKRGKEAGARCIKSAIQRYAACLRGQSLPPLDTWNN